MSHGAGREIPLTLAQELILAGQRLAPASPLYNMAFRFDIDAPVDPEAFARAFAAVARASDAPRAVFAEEAGRPVQRVSPDPPPPPSLVDLSAEPDPDLAADAWTDACTARPFDLARGSVRSALLRLGPGRFAWALVQHHVATDLMGTALFVREVSAAYDRALAGDAALPALPAFADHARAEAAARADGSLGLVRAHWQRLAQARMPASAPYGGRRDGQGASVRVDLELTGQTARRLVDLAGAPGYRSISRPLSVFTILATALAAFLHRVSGDRVVTLGAPAHNRAGAAARRTIGLFIEMFPLRVSVEPGESFASLHAKVAAAAGDWLRNARPGASDATVAGLFGAVLNYIPVSFGRLGGAPVRATWRHCGAQDPGHDLRLHVIEDAEAGSIRAMMDLDRAVFGPGLAERVPGHFARLLEAFLSDPARAIDAVALCADGEAAAIVARHSGPAEPAAEPVLAAFLARAAERPGAVAVHDGDASLDYAGLEVAARGVAARLEAAGMAPGGTAILHAGRSADLVAAMLGVWMAGGRFVPLGAETPGARLKAIADRAGPVAILADAECRAAAEATGRKVLRLDGGGPVQASPETSPRKMQARMAGGAEAGGAAAGGTRAEGGGAAYAIFTSGSTGEPKGVEVDHAAFARYIAWAARAFAGGRPLDWPLVSAIGFDLTLTSIFVPLVTGGAVRVYPATKGGTDLAILEAMREDAVDVVKLTPAHLALAAGAGAPLRRIRTLVLGGETLTTALCRRARDRLGAHLEILNEYGPTEAVVGCMIHRFDPARDDGAAVPVGRPADGTVMRLLDAGGNPVPDGVPAEMCPGGRLAAGYLGRPDLTSERFRPDPMGGGLLYRSGDIGRVLPSGAIDCLGRADDQLKLHGVRVEPAEIAAAIEGFPGVSAAHAGPVAGTGLGTARTCLRCGLPEGFPGLALDGEGICSICRDHERVRERAAGWFSTEAALRARLAAARARRQGRFDAIMLLSGGKDSSYALYRLAEITPDILALTLDNGFISDGAKANIARVCADLGIEHRLMTTEAMGAIFADSLERFSNVCQGCFKTIYTLALREALAEGVPAIVTGLSRGQFFETRLAPALFGADAEPAQIDRMVLEARKRYHRMEDAVSRLLETSDLQADEVFEAVEFIDFYRHVDVPVAEIYRFLAERASWIRPGDTGRSTNCLINDLGIHVHRLREGYHNYALPYSWDVRLGHKTREEARAELEDAIDPGRVRGMLEAIGADPALLEPPAEEGIAAWFTADGAVDLQDLRAHLRRRLPREMVPERLVRIARMPLNANGKVDRAALPRPAAARPARRLVSPAEPALEAVAPAAPADPVAARLLEIWRDALGAPAAGVGDNFYDLGGESIIAIEIAARAAREGIAISAVDIFECQTVAALAERAVDPSEAGPAPAPAEAGDEPLLDLGEADLAALGRALGRPPR